MSSRRMALCGVLSALAASLLLAGGAIGVGTYCGPLLAMAVLLPVLEEYGPGTAGTAWAGVSLLGLLLSADRELALVYLFFGWYPLLRPRIDALPSRLLRLAAKLAVCNITVLALYGLALRLLGLTADLAEGGRAFRAAMLAMANVLFLLADRALARLTAVWHTRLRGRLFRE